MGEWNCGTDVAAFGGYPCIPYEDVTGQSGFFSGFHSIVDGQPQTWNLTVNTTSPVWWYCGAPGSCIGHAMVGVISPDSNTSLNTQIELSRQANYMLEPGQAVPQDALQSMSSLAATATTATVTVSVTGSAPQMRDNAETAGFMTAHNGHYDGAQLPPYQSPVMRHPEFKEMADSRANEIPMGRNMREGPRFSFGQDTDADQHRFSDTSELSGLQSPQELPAMHEIFTPGATNRNAPSPSFS
ncbi:hypothetical protein LTR03_016758 [Friedmanniomyces endolithicus]|nr:hypothetical protein LTR03_016758 [Friedmanniomyces endolithicus]